MNWIGISAIFGFLSVAFGAFGAHALKEKLDAYSLGVYQTGVQYQAIHALAILALGVLMAALPQAANASAAKAANWCFALGIVVFSGSLYALALSGVRALGAITPLGGVLFLVGWALLAKLAWDLKGSS